jgi:hypothetical protein
MKNRDSVDDRAIALALAVDGLKVAIADHILEFQNVLQSLGQPMTEHFLSIFVEKLAAHMIDQLVERTGAHEPELLLRLTDIFRQAIREEVESSCIQ